MWYKLDVVVLFNLYVIWLPWVFVWHSLQPLNALKSAEEEQRLEEVLERLKTQVGTRRLMLYPYFRDFDRVIIQPQ